MAEREGFEPSIGVKAYTPLAGERLQPTRPSLRRRHIILDLFYDEYLSNVLKSMFKSTEYLILKNLNNESTTL